MGIRTGWDWPWRDRIGRERIGWVGGEGRGRERAGGTGENRRGQERKARSNDGVLPRSWAKGQVEARELTGDPVVRRGSCPMLEWQSGGMFEMFECLNV